MTKYPFQNYAFELLDKDYNCGEVVVRVLIKELGLKVPKEILRSSSVMNGGGRAGAQCGILEAGLLILALCYGRDTYKKSRDPLQKYAYQLTKEFEIYYKGTLCRKIRPEGFSPHQPLNLCNQRILHGIQFLLDFLKKI